MKTQRITKRQALLVLITTIIGGVLHPLFRDLILWSGNGAWAPIILATLSSMVVTLLFLRLARLYPNESAAGYLPRIWGRLMGYPLVAVLLLGFLLKAAHILRHVSEFFVAAVLPETPISAVIGVLLFLVVAGILAELEGLVRVNEIVLPIIILSLVLIFLTSAPKFSAWELLPLFDHGSSGLLNSFLIAGSYLSNVTLILFVYPLIVDPNQISLETMKTLAISGVVFLLIYLNIILTLGSHLGQVFTWPYLAVVENFPIGTERSEAIFMVIWFLACFVQVSIFVYVFALGLHQLFPWLKRHWVGLGATLAIGYISLLADNQPSAVIDHLVVNRYALYLFTAIPILSLVVATMRRKRGDRVE